MGMKGFIIGLLTATAISVGAAQIGPRPPAGGGGTTVPTTARLAFTTACPTGWTQDAAMADLMLLGTTAAAGNVGGTGGSNNLTPAGSNSAPTFTGNSVASSLVSGGTPAGTNTQPTLTMNSYTPAGTNGTVSFTPAGTVAAPTFTGASSTVGAQAFTGSSSVTSAHTISWPAGVPTHTGTTASFTGNASTDVVNHLHTLATGTGTTGNFSQVVGTVDTSSGGTGGTPTQTALATRSGNPVSGGVASYTPAGSVTITAQGTIAWPAGVPTMGTGTVTPLGTNGTSTVTPLGSNSAPAFTGSSGTVSAQAFTGTPATLTGTVSQPSFSGNLLATHQHTTVATGSVSAPTFVGDVADNRSAFVRVIWCRVSGPEPAPAQVAAVDPMPWWGLPLAGLIGILAGVGFRRV